MGNPAYPPLGMFKILLLQRWHDLSDHKAAEAMADRISFCRFAGFSLDHESPGRLHHLPLSKPPFKSAACWTRCLT